jgi:hypothetical protein
VVVELEEELLEVVGNHGIGRVEGDREETRRRPVRGG